MTIPRAEAGTSDPEQSREAHERSWVMSKAGLLLWQMYRVRFLVPMVWLSSLGLPNALELVGLDIAGRCGYLASRCQIGTDWTLKQKLAGKKSTRRNLIPTHGTHVVVTVKLVTTKPIIPGAKQPLSGLEWFMASVSPVLVDNRRYLASAGPFCWNRGEA